ITTARRSGGHLSVCFKTDSQEERAFIDRLIGRVDALFGNVFDVVDLETGATVERRTLARWYSADMAEWCKAAPGRFLFTSRETDKMGRAVNPERILGYRPASFPHC